MLGRDEVGADELLTERGVEAVPYIVGRKGVAFYRFRRRAIQQEWTGFSEAPQYSHAREIGDGTVPPGLEQKAYLAKSNCPEFAVEIEEEGT